MCVAPPRETYAAMKRFFYRIPPIKGCYSGRYTDQTIIETVDWGIPYKARVSIYKVSKATEVWSRTCVQRLNQKIKSTTLVVQIFDQQGKILPYKPACFGSSQIQHSWCRFNPRKKLLTKLTANVKISNVNPLLHHCLI